jgi:hypothetical protein
LQRQISQSFSTKEKHYSTRANSTRTKLNEKTKQP